MKKKWLLLALIGTMLIMEAVIISFQNHNAYLAYDDGTLVIEVKSGDAKEVIRPWLDRSSGIYYFFLPAFAKGNTLYRGQQAKEEISINGKSLNTFDRFEWKEEEVYHISCMDASYDVCFMKSKNLPSVFVQTQSGSLDYLYADKSNCETGKIQVFQSSGNMEYDGNLSKIAKRGQVTANVGKIPFSITLEKKAPLCGLESGKKWNLLSLYYEHNKIQTRLIFDMANYLGLEYTSGCEWVDLYCNGEYQGLYLLTEAVTGGDGRIEIYDLEDSNRRSNQGMDLNSLELIRDGANAYYDIQNPGDFSGGYLIEKKYSSRLEESAKAHFVTDTGIAFEIEEPRHPSKEQVDYISAYVEEAGQLLTAGDPAYKQYIDEDSFAKQFLIDMIVLEMDAMSESTFFYLDRDGILKSGPLWDYDRAMGLLAYADYTIPLEEGPGEMKEWYLALYQQDDFREKMLEYYKELLPCLKEMLESRIDMYAGWIGASLQMDRQKWGVTGDTQLTYQSYDNYIRYLKYFLLGRITYLNEEWGIKESVELPEELFTGEKHNVVLKGKEGNVVETFIVQDGKCIGELPPLEAGCEYGWAYLGGWRMYSDKIPVLEDTVLTAR